MSDGTDADMDADMAGQVSALARTIRAKAGSTHRVVVAIAGPPGSGKSTLVEALKAGLDGLADAVPSAIVPMDGFHLDNAVLDAAGWRARKGAPFTFDVAGYGACLARIRAGDADVAVPVFDRTLDLARAGARLVGGEARIVLTEGNYLLLEDAPWSALVAHFDLTVFLDVPDGELERRLLRRWRDHGLTEAAARTRVLDNDMPNARLVKSRSRPADRIVIAAAAQAPL